MLRSLRRTLAMVPYVIEHNPRGMDRVYDIWSRLLKERIVCVMGPVSDDSANAIVAQLLHLESDNPEKPVYMYINSPGGSVTAGMAIYDTMQYIQPTVHTFCMGQAASMGSLLLAAGAKGQRLALPNSRIMVHQPSGGAHGQATDIYIHAEEILKVKRRLNEIYVKHTGKPYDVIENALERDKFMSAEEAIEFGIIDKVMEHRKGQPIAQSSPPTS